MNDVIVSIKGRNGAILELFPNKITIKRKGFVSFMLHGLKGDKDIYLKNITSTQLKKPGLSVGYIQFSIPGGNESNRGVVSAVSDENTFTYEGKRNYELLVLIKGYVESKVSGDSTHTKACLNQIHQYINDKLAEKHKGGVSKGLKSEVSLMKGFINFICWLFGFFLILASLILLTTSLVASLIVGGFGVLFFPPVSSKVRNVFRSLKSKKGIGGKFVGKPLSWFFGVMFTIFAVGNLLMLSVVNSIMCFIIAAFFIPPSVRFMESKLNKKIPSWVKFGIILLSLIVLGF